MISKLNFFFWQRIVSSTYIDDKSLSAFRIIAGLFLFIFYMPNFSWIADMPHAFFDPPMLSLANLFNSFPGKTFFLIIDFLVISSLLCLVTGIKARISTFVYLLSCLIGLSFQYSFGKIDHAILLYAMLGCMAFSGWGRHLAILPDKKSKLDNTAKSLSLFSVLICFGMFTAGFEKALNWIDFDMSYNGFLQWSQSGIYRKHMDYLLAPYVKYFPAIIIEIIDYTAVLFELSPLIFLLISRKAWRLWLLIACTFHLANTLLLNIPFTIYSVVYLTFVDYSFLYKKIKDLLKLSSFKWMVGAVIFIIAIARFLNHFFQFPNIELLSQDQWLRLELYFGLFVWTGAILLVARDIVYNHHRKIRLPKDNTG